VDFVKRERLFVGTAACLAVALLAWNGLFRSKTALAIEEARSRRSAVAVELNALGEQGVPAPEQIALARESLATLRKAVTTEEGSVGYVQAGKFKPPAGVPPMVHFNAELAGANQQLQNKTMVKGISWKVNNRTVGFPGGMLPPDLGEEYLIRLAVVFRIVEAFADLPGGSVLAVHEIAPVEASGGWGGGAPGGGLLRETAYIDRIPVRFKFEAKGPALFRLLHAISRHDAAQERSFLRIDSLIAERPDPNQEKLVVTLTVEAVVVRPGKPLRPEASEPEEEWR
jgi:hypothetical protein